MTVTVPPYGLEVGLEYNGLLMHWKPRWNVNCYIVEEISGLDDADIRVGAIDSPDAHGETAGPGFYGGRTIVIEGRIRATDVTTMRQMQSNLRQAVGQSFTEKSLIFRTGVTQSDVYINARKSQGVQMRESQNNLSAERPFMITLRASDPRFLSVAMATAFATNPVTAFLTLSNTGTWSEYPTIQLTGPMSSITVSNTLTGDHFYINVAIPAAEVWTMDVKARTLMNGSTIKYSALHTDSDWVTVEPGFNVFRVAATGTTITSRIDITHRYAWI